MKVTKSTNNVSERWQTRFQFFDQHGGPMRHEAKQAIMERPEKERFLILFNLGSFFLPVIHFLKLGLWKKALTLLVATIITVLVFDMPLRMFGINGYWLLILVPFFFSAMANYSYYLKEVKGVQGWNPFEYLSVNLNASKAPEMSEEKLELEEHELEKPEAEQLGEKE